jgi:general secretion pathway protein H
VQLQTHIRTTSASSGFTLIELLVVIVIIGVIVSVATLSVNVLGRDSEADNQAQRLWAVLKQTREESELQSSTVGMYMAAEQFEFLRLDPRLNQWVPIADDKLYATRELPEGLRFRLWLDSREVVLKPKLPERSDQDDEDKDKLTDEEKKEEANLPAALRSISREPKPAQTDPPQVVILSNGEIMPFEVQIERDREPAEWRIQALPDTDLRVERRNKDREWDIVGQTLPPVDEKEARGNARK